MSLRYRDANGVESIIAGLTPGGDIEAGAVDTRNGVFSFSVASGSHEKFTVTFDTPMIDNDYIVDIWSDIHNMEYLTFNIEGKRANGFDVNVNNAYGATITRSGIKYKAYKVYTVQHAAQNAEDIANIKAVIPSTASSSNKLATSNDVITLATDTYSRLDDLEDLVPTGASVTNQLATKDNIDTVTANANSRLKVVDIIPSTPADGDVILFIGSEVGYRKGGIYQYSTSTTSWVLISTADIEVDSAIDSTSENPVQNKVIAEALDDKQDLEFIGTMAEWDALATAQKKEYKIANITNDVIGGEVADSVTDGLMSPVTSNAVYDAIAAATVAIPSAASANNKLVTNNEIDNGHNKGAGSRTFKIDNAQMSVWPVVIFIGFIGNVGNIAVLYDGVNKINLATNATIPASSAPLITYNTNTGIGTFACIPDSQGTYGGGVCCSIIGAKWID